jgi:hypothetical protein
MNTKPRVVGLSQCDLPTAKDPNQVSSIKLAAKTWQQPERVDKQLG